MLFFHTYRGNLETNDCKFERSRTQIFLDQCQTEWDLGAKLKALGSRLGISKSCSLANKKSKLKHVTGDKGGKRLVKVELLVRVLQAAVIIRNHGNSKWPQNFLQR